MADFKNLVTFPVDYRPGSSSAVTSYRYPNNVKWIGGTDGAQCSSIAVDNGGDASTDSNGTGFAVEGSPYVDSRTGGGLKVDRYGQKDGRVLVRVGHQSKSSGSSTLFETNLKGMHLYGVVGLAFKYNNVDSDSGYKALMNRIMIQYAWKDGGYYRRKVYDATQKLTGSESLRADLGTGEKLYSYALPDSEKDLVIDNKMTCEGFYLEFKANKSPGCCKSKHIIAWVWSAMPIIQSSKTSSLSSSAPSFVHCPVAYNTTVSTATGRSGMMELATS